MSDQSTTIQDLKDMIWRFAEDRNWDKWQTAKSLSAMTVTEAAELLEIFRFDDPLEADMRFRDLKQREAIADEVVDVIWSALAIADRYGLDLATEFARKFAKNSKKHAVANVRAKHQQRIALLAVEKGKILLFGNIGNSVETQTSTPKAPLDLPMAPKQNIERDEVALGRALPKEASLQIKPGSLQFLTRLQKRATKESESILYKLYTGKVEQGSGKMTATSRSGSKVDTKIRQAQQESTSSKKASRVGWFEISEILAGKSEIKLGPCAAMVIEELRLENLII